MLFECPDCNSKTEYSSETIPEDITSTSTIVCQSCQTLHDIVDEDKNTKKSKYDKTNYINKIAGITNQLAYTRKATYTVPCPHCKHIYEFKGIPIKSVHMCAKCYGYFGINDVKVTISKDGFKTGFPVSPIYPDSIFDRDIDKLADVWSNYKPSAKKIIANH